MQAQIRLVGCFSLTLFLLFRAGDPGADTQRLGRSKFAAGVDAAALRQLKDQGNLLYLSGKYPEAEAVYERAYRLAVAQGQTRFAIQFLHGRGNCRFATSRLRSAMDDYLEARRFAEASGDFEMAGQMSYAVAVLYLQWRDLDASRVEAERGLAAISNTGRLQDHALLTVLLAKIHARAGDFAGAMPLFQKGIEEADRCGNIGIAATAWDELGYLLLREGRLEEAERALTEAFRLRKMNRNYEIIVSYLYLGALRSAQRDFVSAGHLLDAAVATAKSNLSIAQTFSAYRERGRLRMEQGRIPEALADLGTSLKLARAYRLDALPADSDRIGAENVAGNVYGLFIDAAWKLYSQTGRQDIARQAFEAAEENRAASLRARIAESGREELPAEYGVELARLHRAEVAALAGGDAALQEEIRRLRATLTEMEARAGLDAVPAGAHLDSWAGGGSAHGLTTRPTQDFVKRTQLRLGPHDALVTFHLGQFDSYRWIVTRNTFAFDRLPPGPALAAEVEGFANSIKSNAPAAVQEGERLYSELFGGRGKMLENKSNWLLALDDALFRLPLAALPVGRHGNRPLYLVERHATRVIPTVLFLEQAGRPAQPQNGLFLGVGDPVYNRADPRWPETGAAPWASWFAKASNDPLQMPRLIGSGREVEACARIWSRPPSSAVLLEGMDVSYARLEQELKKNPAAVHFAVHVLQPRQAQERGYDQTKPMAHPGEGYLALSLSPSGEPDFLSPAQISAWRARLGLVVLSGCSSASGDVLPATGLMGLTRAWLAAGAEAVAASQWATPDTGGEFFQTFYSRLRSASPAAALQQAQQSMITSGAWCSAPSYWAAYFVIGKD